MWGFKIICFEDLNYNFFLHLEVFWSRTRHSPVFFFYSIYFQHLLLIKPSKSKNIC